MASDLLGFHGYNRANGVERLIAVWAKAPMIYNPDTEGWNRAAGITLTADTKAEFQTFLDYAFMVNGVDPNYTYDGTTWSTTVSLGDAPIAKFIAEYNVRLYLLNIKIAGVSYPSRMWFSDLPKNNLVTWGLETGSDLVQTANSAEITSAGSLFKTRNIKVGDPVMITSGDNAGEYTVQSIDSETQITLTETLDNADTDSDFWAGGNFIDIVTDDGDEGKSFGHNSNELLIYKRNSLHRFSSRGEELRRVKAIPGTTSRRSIVNVGSETYHYHPTGIWQVTLPTGKLVSKAIQDVIDGVTDANQTEVVGWKEDETIMNMYLGNVTLRDGVEIENCVVSLDTTTTTWSIRSYPFTIEAAEVWLEDNVPSVYVGDNASHVYKLDTGTDFADDPIPFELETKPYFMIDDDTIVTFNKLRLDVENGFDLKVLYKLYYMPTSDDRHWINDKDWKPLEGSQRGQKSEWYFPADHNRACGVALKFIESSVRESFLLEKFKIYYSAPADY